MSPDDLLDIADRVVGLGARRRAGRGRRRRTRATPTIRVYEGDDRAARRRPSRRVSASASSRDHRQGFAYAGTLDDDVARRDARRGARQRQRSARPTSSSAWPSPTASPSPDLDLFRDGLADVPHRPQGRARDRARARGPRRRPAHLRRRVGRLRRRVVQEAAVVTTTGIRTVEPRDRRATSIAYVLAERGRRDPDRLRLLGRPRARRPRRRRGRRATRSSGPPACSVRPSRRAERRHRRARPVGHRAAARRSSAARSPARRCSRAARCSPTASARRWRRRSSRSSTTRPNPLAFTATADRRRGPRHPPQRAHRRRRAAGLPAQRLHGAARWARRRPARRCAAASSRRPASAARAVALAPGTATPGRADRRGRRRHRSSRRCPGLHSGVNPVQRRLLDRCRGPAHPRRRARRAGARVHHRLDVAAHAARRRGGRRRPRVAADERRRASASSIHDVTVSGA